MEIKWEVKSSSWNTIVGALLSGLGFLHLYAFESLHFFVTEQHVVHITWDIMNLIKCIPSDCGKGTPQSEVHGSRPVTKHLFVTVCTETASEIESKLLETFIVIGHCLAPKHGQASQVFSFFVILQFLFYFTNLSVWDREEEEGFSSQRDGKALLQIPANAWAPMPGGWVPLSDLPTHELRGF